MLAGTLCIALGLGACSTLQNAASSASSLNPFRGSGGEEASTRASTGQTEQISRSAGSGGIAVNPDIWNAALDILSFLPVQSIDPFTGVIITGFGAPPGGGRAYRATVFVSDPALDARSLKVALFSRSGQVSPETTREVERAILNRARQLRNQR
ncbi:MAG: DUF3576 domain-containing protein [Pseudomonadota bacterium]